MTVDAEVWHWTAAGMRMRLPTGSSAGYITVRDAERLLEEAHARGRRAAEGERLRGAEYLEHLRDTGEP
jgi:hypothetical protein